jgi:hypothetical protein
MDELKLGFKRRHSFSRKRRRHGPAETLHFIRKAIYTENELVEESLRLIHQLVLFS